MHTATTTTSAADFCALPAAELLGAITDTSISSRMVIINPGMAAWCTVLLVLDELSAVGEAGGSSSTYSEICFIKAHGRAALLPIDDDDDDDEPGIGVRACSPSVLATVLSEEIIGTDDKLIVN